MQAAEAKPEQAAADDLDLLRDAAVEAAAIAMCYFRKDPEVWMKPGDSPVSEADYAVDHFLREKLTAARPSYGWLSEETDDNSDRLAAARVFVVDPIDGTRDFLAGGEHWCVSIAIVENHRPVVGVLQRPVVGQLLCAQSGQGAFVDGVRLKVANPVGAARIGGPAVIVTPFADHWASGVTRVAYAPSLAYRVAMIAAGKIDATFIKPNAHDWDLAAAHLILNEAGGAILNVDGLEPVYATAVTKHGPLVAGSGELLQAMRAEMASFVAKSQHPGT